MKKIFTVFVLACAFTAANANYDAALTAARAKEARAVQAFVQPFDVSYSATLPYLWYTDIDLTDPVGSFRGIFDEIDRLHRTFGGYSFSHIPYMGLQEFEYGFGLPLYFATIYSELSWSQLKAGTVKPKKEQTN